MSNQSQNLLSRLRELAHSHARMGLYKAEEWIEWEAADEIEKLRAALTEAINLMRYGETHLMAGDQSEWKHRVRSFILDQQRPASKGTSWWEICDEQPD